jgi:hypothetical protein
MLSVSRYSQEFVDQSRASIDARISAFDALAAAADPAAVEAFEPTFFNDMVLVLDHHFLHRGRSFEGKDGNPLNEVRMLCNSLVDNDGTMAPDKTIRMKPDQTLLNYAIGDAIAVREDGFRRLADGFFAEIESRYA